MFIISHQGSHLSSGNRYGLYKIVNGHTEKHNSATALLIMPLPALQDQTRRPVLPTSIQPGPVVIENEGISHYVVRSYDVCDIPGVDINKETGHDRRTGARLMAIPSASTTYEDALEQHRRNMCRTMAFGNSYDESDPVTGDGDRYAWHRNVRFLHQQDDDDEMEDVFATPLPRAEQASQSGDESTRVEAMRSENVADKPVAQPPGLSLPNSALISSLKPSSISPEPEHPPNIPADIQALADHINSLPCLKLGRRGDHTAEFPSRNLLKKDARLQGEISRKSGCLVLEKSGGRLRKWYGDERLFGERMWRYLTDEKYNGKDDGIEDAVVGKPPRKQGSGRKKNVSATKRGEQDTESDWEEHIAAAERHEAGGKRATTVKHRRDDSGISMGDLPSVASGGNEEIFVSTTVDGDE